MIVELLSRLWLKGVGKMLKDIGRMVEGCWKNGHEDKVDDK